MSHKKTLISNFLSLSGVQLASYVLPLINVPYLVRVLGPEKFGLIAFAQAFIGYFLLITDYGFNLTATREISINRNNEQKISEIFSSVMIIKMGLLFLSFLTLCLFVFTIDKFKIEWKVYLASFGVVAGNALFPTWFFQGMEKMKQVALLNILSKAIFTGSIFVFIRTQSDYIYLPLINSAGFVAAGLLSLWMIFRQFGVSLKVPTLGSIKFQLNEGWHIFLSQIAINLYTVSNTFILGLFTNNTIVGYYSAGEKIVRAVLGTLGPLSQTIYPHISKLSSESRESALVFIRKVVKLVVVPSFLVSLVLLIFAPLISDIVLGKQFKESIHVIQILSFLPFLISLSNLFGIQTMLNFGLKKTFTKILATGSFVNIFLGLILVVPLQHIGIAISALASEMCVSVYMFIILEQHNLNVLQIKALFGTTK